MIARPTTTLSILGGASTENEWGDPVDADTVVTARVPAALTEQPRQVVADEGQREPVTIVYVVAFIPRRITVDSTQRVRDDRTGVTYLIDKVTRPQHPSIPQDTRLDLRNAS